MQIYEENHILRIEVINIVMARDVPYKLHIVSLPLLPFGNAYQTNRYNILQENHITSP